MNTIALAKELIKIIKSGDVSYAVDYHEMWCKGVEWSRFEATEIILACRLWEIDPLRFNARVKPMAQDADRISYGYATEEE